MREMNEDRIDDILREHGSDYLREESPDDEIYDMSEFNEIMGDNAFEAVEKAFYGVRWMPGYDNCYSKTADGDFNPTDAYFAFNGYGNLISIQERDYLNYLKDKITDIEDFLGWVKEKYN